MGIVLTMSFSRRPIHLNTWKYTVCSIKLGIKVLRLHKIRVQIFALLLVNKFVVDDF